MKQNQSLYSRWLGQLSINIFIQTFHAFVMYISLLMISGANDLSAGSNAIIDMGENGVTEAFAVIITIVSLTAIIKLEKTLKTLFGFGNSVMGEATSPGEFFKGAVNAANLAKNTVSDYNQLGADKKELNKRRSNRMSTGNVMNTLALPSGGGRRRSVLV